MERVPLGRGGGYQWRGGPHNSPGRAARGGPGRGAPGPRHPGGDRSPPAPRAPATHAPAPPPALVTTPPPPPPPRLSPRAPTAAGRCAGGQDAPDRAGARGPGPRGVRGRPGAAAAVGGARELPVRGRWRDHLGQAGGGGGGGVAAAGQRAAPRGRGLGAGQPGPEPPGLGAGGGRPLQRLACRAPQPLAQYRDRERRPGGSARPSAADQPPGSGVGGLQHSPGGATYPGQEPDVVGGLLPGGYGGPDHRGQPLRSAAHAAPSPLRRVHGRPCWCGAPTIGASGLMLPILASCSACSRAHISIEHHSQLNTTISSHAFRDGRGLAWMTDACLLCCQGTTGTHSWTRMSAPMPQNPTRRWSPRWPWTKLSGRPASPACSSPSSTCSAYATYFLPPYV